MFEKAKRFSKEQKDIPIDLDKHNLFHEPVVNKDPLVKTPFIPLPLGAVKAEGWLLKQLQLQKNGATGYSEQLYDELNENSAWLGGDSPDSDWERPVYYVKGLLPLAYLLNDQVLIERTEKWVKAILNSQQDNGFFGPRTNDDWWPRMIALYVLKDYYEVTGNEDVLLFMTHYFIYQAKHLTNRPLREWGKIRVGDNIETVLWLYNRTGDEFLLELADLLAEQGYPITDIFTNNKFQEYGDDFHPTHTVNVNQSIKMPAIYYQRSHAQVDKEAFQQGVKNLKIHEQITDMTAGTEMLSGSSSTQGVELCAIVERMYSNETAAMILGDPKIGDSLEKIAFNALPGGMDKELKVHQYYALPNQVESDYAEHGFKQDYHNGIMPSPTSGFPCCRFNMHMGWPYFVKNMWAATEDGGVGVIAYGPSQVSLKINDAEITIKEITNYPFEEEICFSFHTSKEVQFPFKLRIPAWADHPVITVNGEKVEHVQAGKYITINRKWQTGDQVILNVPMKLRTTTWIHHSIGIERGPIVYSLLMNEEWMIKDQPIQKKKDFNPTSLGFNEYQVKAKNNWNYGLIIDRKNPEKSIDIIKQALSDHPFDPKETPIQLQIKAKKIVSWGKSANKVDADEPPVSPIFTDQPIEEIRLVPYGAQNVRITYFPQITEVVENMDVLKYEAEHATIFQAKIKESEAYASNGQFIGDIIHDESYVKFNSIIVPKAGVYTVDIWFANGNGYNSASGNVFVNGERHHIIFQGTLDWGRFMATTMEVYLGEGVNTIKFMKDKGQYDLDYIVIRPSV